MINSKAKATVENTSLKRKDFGQRNVKQQEKKQKWRLFCKNYSKKIKEGNRNKKERISMNRLQRGKITIGYKRYT